MSNLNIFTFIFAFVVVNLMKYYLATNKANFINWFAVIKWNKRNKKKTGTNREASDLAQVYFIIENKYKTDYNSTELLCKRMLGKCGCIIAPSLACERSLRRREHARDHLDQPRVTTGTGWIASGPIASVRRHGAWFIHEKHETLSQLTRISTQFMRPRRGSLISRGATRDRFVDTSVGRGFEKTKRTCERGGRLWRG